MSDYKIIMMNTEKLKPYENNPRFNDNAVDAVAKSIENFGFKVPIVVDKYNVIVTGHTRLKAAQKLGLAQVPVIVADDLTPEKIKAFRLADNKVSELADWDFSKLEAELAGLEMDMTAFNFDMKELSKEFDKNKEVTEDDFDVDAELNNGEEPTVKRGQVWKLGNHYLMCGDSTSKEDVSKLMQSEIDGGGNGLIKADMVFTDPPYGVDYKGINNDSRKGLEQLLDNAFENMKNFSKKGASVYCFHSDKCADIFQNVFRKYCNFSSMVIWKKQSLVLSQTDFQSIHEPCMYGWFNNGTHNFYADRKQTSVWEYDRKSIEGHTTPKPVELIAHALTCSSKDGETVLDLFGGSGSTLIACEQLNRKARLMELDPKYCDVIIKRWETLTGKQAVKL